MHLGYYSIEFIPKSMEFTLITIMKNAITTIDINVEKSIAFILWI